MLKFASVSPLFWNDPKVREWNDSQQKLALYLLTSPHRNMQGLFLLSLRYMAEDVGWSEARTKRSLDRLEADGFVEYDAAARVVLLPKALKHYQPKTTPQLKGALSTLASVPDTRLKQRFVEQAQVYEATELLDALANGVPEEKPSDG